MAKMLDVVLAAGAIRDALFRQSDRTGDPARKQFILGRHLLLEDAAQAFAAAPAVGVDSPSYDAIVERCRAAAQAIAPLDPSVDTELQRIGEYADSGIDALHQVTGKAIVTVADAPASPWRLRGALRVRTGTASPPDVTIATAGGPPSPPPGAGVVDPILSRLTKLFPAEAVSVYTAGATLLHEHGPAQPATPAMWWFPLLVAVGLAVVRALATQPTAGGRPQIAAIVAAVVSFLLWVVMLGDWFLPGAGPGGRAPLVAGAIAGVWVWVAPFVVERIDGPSA